MKKLQIDNELKNLIPPLTKEEFNQLEKNLIEEGCRDSLVIWKDIIIDGHNRYKICTANNIPFGIKEIDFENRQEAFEWIIKNQFGRRNLPAYERAKLALKLKPIIQQKAKENKVDAIKQAEQFNSKKKNSLQQISDKTNKLPISTDKELAKIAGVSHDTIHKVEVIESKGSDEIKEKLKNKEISINKAYRETKGTRVCGICGKEKPLSEFYSTQVNCRECELARKKAGLTVQKAKELHNKFSDEKLNALYEEMKNPCPPMEGTGKSNYKPIIAEFEELLNDFNIKINKYLFMEEYFSDAKEIKNSIKININNLEKIIKFIKE